MASYVAMAPSYVNKEMLLKQSAIGLANMAHVRWSPSTTLLGN